MIRIGVIGFGYWGQNLARCFATLDGALVAAIADGAQAQRHLARRLYPSARVSAALDDVLEVVDAVAIATPAETHYALASTALAAGKHVLVEKPLARTREAAASLGAVADAHGLTLMVDHTFLYSGAVRKIKTLLAGGALGDLLYFDSVRVNLGVFRSDVDVLWDLAAHDVSILCHLVGVPGWVSAIAAHCEGYERADVAYLTMWFDSGPIGHAHVSWLSPVKIRRVLIGGTEALVVYDDMEPSEKVRVYERGPDKPGDRKRADYRLGDCWAPKLETREPLLEVCDHFLWCIREQQPPLTGHHDGVAVVRVLEAASASSMSGGAKVAV